jgi:arsenate reductase
MGIWVNPACSTCRVALGDGLAAHPRALQRPIITAADGTTVIGRDPGSVARAIDHETSS